MLFYVLNMCMQDVKHVSRSQSMLWYGILVFDSTTPLACAFFLAVVSPHSSPFLGFTGASVLLGSGVVLFLPRTEVFPFLLFCAGWGWLEMF